MPPGDWFVIFRPPALSSLQLSCARQFGGVFVLAPIALASGTTLPLLGPWSAVQWAATATGVLSGLAFTVLLYVIRTAGPVFASQTAYLITLAGVAWGLLLFDERHSLYVADRHRPGQAAGAARGRTAPAGRRREPGPR